MPAEPLDLLEVGGSAGVCLLPDRYGYDYGSVRIEPSQSVTRRPPTFACEVHGPVSIPRAVPRIVWRLCLDLHPVDLSSGQEVAWLETLVWPGQNERAEHLRGAIRSAQAEPPKVIRGDLLTDLEPLIAAAPRNATLVVFHTAVLATSDHLPTAGDLPKSYVPPGRCGSATRLPGYSPLSRTRPPPLHRQSASSWRSSASPSLGQAHMASRWIGLVTNRSVLPRMPMGHKATLGAPKSASRLLGCRTVPPFPL